MLLDLELGQETANERLHAAPCLRGGVLDPCCAAAAAVTTLSPRKHLHQGTAKAGHAPRPPACSPRLHSLPYHLAACLFD
jgi:hypothetical protein